MRYAAAAILGAMALAGCRFPNARTADHERPFEHHGYAWQAAALTAWAGQDSEPDLAIWWLAGQVDSWLGKLQVRSFPPPPEKDISGAVVRLRTPVIDWIASAADSEIRDTLALPLATFACSDRPDGERLQLDFDCPTAKLHHYGRLLAQMRAALPEAELSITALPDWLRSKDFAALLNYVDFYVLQVHGLSKPANQDDSAPVFDGESAAHYLEATAALGAPSYIALPTYGHRQWFRADGSFVGISGEVPVDLSSAAHYVRVERADPRELAAFLRILESRRPATLRGVFWFRLPAEEDELNWCTDTFLRVLAGEVPMESLRAEARETEAGLIEVHLRNGLERDYRGRAEVRVTLDPGVRVWGEGLRGFTFAQRGAEAIYTGRAPSPGESLNIGWLRVQAPAALDATNITPRARSLQ